MFRTEKGKAEEQKFSPTAFGIIPLDEGCTIEPDTEQEEGVASDDIVGTSSQDGSLGNDEGEADSTHEAGVEFYNKTQTQKGGMSIVFRSDGEDWSIVQPPHGHRESRAGESRPKSGFWET